MTARTASADPTRLGSTLRSILLRPEDGFAGAIEIANERARDDATPDEGYAPTVLTALGGASLMATWLKVGGMLDRRQVPAEDFSWLNLGLALALGSILALIALFLWGRVGPITYGAMHARASRRDLRIVWGAAWFPQVLGGFILLPLDLLIVGPGSFTTDSLGDSLSTAWAAFSIAIALALVFWSLYLFVKGTEVAADVRVGRSTVGVAVGGLCLAALVAAFIAGALALSETLS